MTINRARPLLLVLLAFLGACATNPVTKKSEISFVSEQQEISIGNQQYLQSQQSAGGKFILDPALAAYVNEVGQQAGQGQRPAEPALRIRRHQRFGAQCLGPARRQAGDQSRPAHGTEERGRTGGGAVARDRACRRAPRRALGGAGHAAVGRRGHHFGVLAPTSAACRT
jgi:hypothetical protein